MACIILKCRILSRGVIFATTTLATSATRDAATVQQEFNKIKNKNIRMYESPDLTRFNKIAI